MVYFAKVIRAEDLEVDANAGKFRHVMRANSTALSKGVVAYHSDEADKVTVLNLTGNFRL